MKLITLALLAVLVSFDISAQLKINEICPGNADIIYDTTFYEFGGWIELYNHADAPVSIGGFFLSDDPANPTKWTVPTGTSIPGKGYFIIWADKNNRGFHTNFSLDPDGEYLSLHDASVKLLDQVTFPEQYTNVSYGRPGNNNDWVYFKNPSPRALNNSTSATSRIGNPRPSLGAGVYVGGQTLKFDHSNSGTKIYFTLDGSEPTESSTLYSNPITISQTTVVKAKAFHPNFLPSKTEVNTYFISNRKFTLPVMSLSLNPAYLNDDMIGIYVEGKNGIPGSGTDFAVNWNQNWYRHTVVEYFKPDGEKIFDESMDMRVYGNFSRRKPQKSFALKARDKYGKSTLNHKIFPLKEFNSYGGFLLRNAGTDWNKAHFRDALMQRMTVGQLDLDYMDYQPTIVFLNGVYWGILNLREKNDEDYFQTNYGIARDDLDMLEGSSRIEAGDRIRYNTYLDSLRKIDRGSAAAMKFVDRYIDTQNFINYQLHNIYIVNTDWPGNNLKYWRQRSNNGKFKWMLWDNDFGFGCIPAEGDWDHQTLAYATDPQSTGGHNKSWSTLHFRLLLENPVFRQRYIASTITAMQTTYEPTRVVGLINEFEQGIAEEIPYHKEKWGGKAADWKSEVDKMKTFATKRHAFFRQHLIDFFALTDEVKINVKATPANGGSYKLNGIETSRKLEDAFYFQGLPFKVSAIPGPGYKFKKWKLHKKDHTIITPASFESSWKYYDKGALPASDWASVNYSPENWKSGQGEFGYGEGDEKTKVSYGPASSNKYVTTYFRKEFEISDVNNLLDIKASVLYDDGAVVYVNGVEVYRANLPSGDISYSTLATTVIGNEVTATFPLDKSIFVNGKNVIAVEVHQAALTSSDLSFDLSISYTQLGNFVSTESTSETIESIAYSDVTIEAVFEPFTSIVINEISTANSVYEDAFGDTDDWIELHNSGTTAVNVAGLYVTDELADKAKFRIPSGSSETLMQPGDYLLLWADGETAQGPTHLNFKLSDEGEALGLYQKEGDKFMKVDEVVFGFLMKNQSFARSPNATGPFNRTYYTTPLEENPVVLSVEQNEDYKFGAYPNPTGSILNLDFPSGNNKLTMYDTFGRILQDFGTVQHTAQIDLSNFTPGVYILKVYSRSQSGFARIVKH